MQTVGHLDAHRKIKILPPGVSEKIAAGEMIERPASVVKELVENALDAGATEVHIRLEDGGKKLIEITDNGSGMSPEDLSLSIQRHATSKISGIEDLDRIRTLGFRGEALPSIAAVSDLKIISREKDASSAYELRPGSSPERVTFGHFNHSAHGTLIQARGIFSQVPARLKFLKSQAAEVTQVRDILERVSLAFPHVGFSLQSEARSLFQVRPEELLARVKRVLSEDDDFPIVSTAPGEWIEVHWVQGLSLPHSRRVIQLVNGRSVKDRLLQQAILTPFRQALLPGQYPAVLLKITIDPSELDVNVHPTKTEVRFLDNRRVFQQIHRAIQALILDQGAPTYAAKISAPRLDIKPHVQEPFRYSARLTDTQAAEAPPDVSVSRPSHALFKQPVEHQVRKVAEHQVREVDDEPIQKVPMLLEQARFVGVLFHTYLTYEEVGTLILIDQHAADERIRYERLKHRYFRNDDLKTEAYPSQVLLIPETIHFPVEKKLILEESLAHLQKLGFEVEFFGEDTLLFRGVPPEWGTEHLHLRIKGLINRLIEKMEDLAIGAPLEVLQREILQDEALFESLASEACHSAVRAGDPLHPLAAEEIVRNLFMCEHPWNCPHGRPTVVKIPQGKLEEWFQRRV